MQGISNTTQVAIQEESYYDKNATQRVKIASILKKFNRFLYSSEIKAEIAKQEGAEAKSISASLAALKKKNTITKIQVGNQIRNSFWGSPKWLNSNGKIKAEYLYDKKHLSEPVENTVNL